jgi:hypothetical protein
VRASITHHLGGRERERENYRIWASYLSFYQPTLKSPAIVCVLEVVTLGVFDIRSSFEDPCFNLLGNWSFEMRWDNMNWPQTYRGRVFLFFSYVGWMEVTYPKLRNFVNDDSMRNLGYVTSHSTNQPKKSLTIVCVSRLLSSSLFDIKLSFKDPCLV